MYFNKLIKQVPPFTKTCLFRSYELRDFHFDDTLVMPLFTLYVSDKFPKDHFKRSFIRNP